MLASYAPRLYFIFWFWKSLFHRLATRLTKTLWGQAHWITKITLTPDWMDGEAHWYKKYLRYKEILVPLLKCLKEKHCFAVIIFMYIHCSSCFVQPAHGFPLSAAISYSPLCKFHTRFEYFITDWMIWIMCGRTLSSHSIDLSIQWHSRMNKADVAIAFDPLP